MDSRKTPEMRADFPPRETPQSEGFRFRERPVEPELKNLLENYRHQWTQAHEASLVAKNSLTLELLKHLPVELAPEGGIDLKKTTAAWQNFLTFKTDSKEIVERFFSIIYNIQRAEEMPKIEGRKRALTQELADLQLTKPNSPKIAQRKEELAVIEQTLTAWQPDLKLLKQPARDELN